VTIFINCLFFAALIPILWQVPRTFWPVHLNAEEMRFTGLYRRYSIESFTGYASNVRTWETSRIVGSVSTQTSGVFIPGGFSSTTTVHDGRRKFTSFHTSFVLTDEVGTTRQIDAVNVGATVHQGELVSAVWLVHNGKSGNTFLVYNHATNGEFVETTRSGYDTARRGLVKMVFFLPTVYVVILCLGIVTIPFLVVLSVGGLLQLRRFRNHGVQPLVATLKRRATGFPLSRLQVVSAASPAKVGDLASQIKEIAALHDSGALTNEEFTQAKSKLLGT
jgi:hypothetical protein